MPIADVASKWIYFCCDSNEWASLSSQLYEFSMILCTWTASSSPVSLPTIESMPTESSSMLTQVYILISKSWWENLPSLTN